MATIRKGKLKGQEVKITQWRNDWFMCEPGGIVSHTNLILTADEIIDVATHNNNGMLFGLFELSLDGIFKRRKK